MDAINPVTKRTHRCRAGPKTFVLFVYALLNLIHHLAAASALNSIFAQWNIKADTEQWNTTGDPCTGAAIDDSVTIDNPSHNPFIKCQCTFNSSSICRITAL